MKNRIYYFTGTGNCLKAAQELGAHLQNCELVSIGNKADYRLDGEYQRVGIVFPVYYQGLPLAVCEAVKQINWPSNPGAYCFAVATCGALAGNALAQLARLMQQQGASLHFSAKLIMFSNCVTLYNMSTKVQQSTRKSQADLLPIIRAVAEKRQTPPKRFRGILHRYYRMQAGKIPGQDHGFHTNNNCTSCGICQKVCPVGNIAMEQGRPVYQHRCQQCLACIQYCPSQAINYKTRTQTRRRYHHPAISATMLIQSRQPS